MADYTGVLEEFRARRTAIARELADPDTAIAAIERLVTPTSSSVRVDEPQVAAAIAGVSRTYANLTMPQAIAKFFARLHTREPQTTRQIINALQAGGFSTQGPIVRGHVYNTMHRLSQDDGPYVHEADGRWSVKRWNEQSDGASNQFALGA
jgi:hypothetical protein